MITGLVAITPAAGVVDGWGAIVLGAFSGSIPWFTMNFFPKIIPGFKRIDDTLGVFHTHAVAGFLGGLLTGFFASKNGCIAFACGYIGPNGYPGGAIVGNWYQVALQIYGALFIIALNIVVTAVLLLLIKLVIPLRMSEKQLLIGDDAIHGEEAYAFFGDGQRSLLSTDIEQPAVNGDGESGVPAKELEIGEEAHNE
jgi:Amt family ammonium transporter